MNCYVYVIVRQCILYCISFIGNINHLLQFDTKCQTVSICVTKC